MKPDTNSFILSNSMAAFRAEPDPALQCHSYTCWLLPVPVANGEPAPFSSVLLWTEMNRFPWPMLPSSYSFATIFKHLLHVKFIAKCLLDINSITLNFLATPQIGFILSTHRWRKWDLPIVTHIVNARSKMWAIISTPVHYCLSCFLSSHWGRGLLVACFLPSPMGHFISITSVLFTYILGFPSGTCFLS